MPFDFNALLQNPSFVMGMNLLGGGKNGMQNATQALEDLQKQKQQREQQAQLMDLQNRQLAEAQTQHASEAEYHRRLADIGEGNLGVNQTHANLYSGQAALANEKMRRDMANDEAFNTQFLPQIQSWLGRMGAGGQPAAPTGATQQMMQPQPPQQPGVDPTMRPPAVMGGPGMGGQGMGGQAPMQQQPSALFQNADKFVSKIEGGFTPNDAGAGPTNFGVNQKANPDVDVKSLTPDTAAQIRKTRYWDAVGGDNLPPATAMVAYDAAINQGVPYARQLIQTTGGDPSLMLQQRKTDYQELAKQPRFAGQYAGWASRLEGLKTQVSDVGGQGQQAPQQQQPGAGAASPSATGLAPDQQMRVIGAMQLMRDPATRAQGMKELAEAVSPKFAAPGSVDVRTGQALPNPQLEEEARHHKVEEGFGANKDVRETVKSGQELAKFPGELQQQGATLAKTQAEVPEIVARTGKEQATATQTQQGTDKATLDRYNAFKQYEALTGEMRDLYTKLKDRGAIVDTDKGPLENLVASRKSSAMGQKMAASGLSTKAALEDQSIRNRINSIKPLMMAAMKNAYGMGAKQMDSNTELAFYNAANTDPTKDVQSNFSALDRLDKLLGPGSPGYSAFMNTDAVKEFEKTQGSRGNDITTKPEKGTSANPMTPEEYMNSVNRRRGR